MEGYIIYTDVGYENDYGEIDESISNCKVYESEKEAVRNAKTIWKYRKEYDIEEVGVVELHVKRFTKNPRLIKRFDSNG